MKKIMIIISIIFIFLTVDATMISQKNNIIKNNEEKEISFIYISYIEYLSNFNGNSSSINKIKIDKMIENIASYKFNTILLHTNPFSDAIYPSKYFPYSYTLTGTEGKNPGFDYLEYFIKKAHTKKIKVHAWINPYRVSSNNDIEKISNNNPAYMLRNTDNIGISNKGIYYNPTSETVKKLILSSIEELINNYDIDGIHFDDYFYVDYEIDNTDYKKYLQTGGQMSLKEYRLENTTDLIKRTQKIIKNKNKNIVFSIAPDGNINNNYLYHFADVKNWINNNYIDYIMPQLYYGFNNQYLPFEKAYNNWLELLKDSNVKMIPVLAFYKMGIIDNNAGSGKNEWLNNGIIENQIKFLKSKNNYIGFGIFRYDYLFSNFYYNEILLNEVNLVHKIM